VKKKKENQKIRMSAKEKCDPFFLSLLFFLFFFLFFFFFSDEGKKLGRVATDWLLGSAGRAAGAEAGATLLGGGTAASDCDRCRLRGFLAGSEKKGLFCRAPQSTKKNKKKNTHVKQIISPNNNTLVNIRLK
jgi:hypothetical protein